MKLGKYYFECGYILLNSILRRSILYSAETYYNLCEKELREIEKIEEDYLRELVGTERTCPTAQLYLEFGHYPARFDIIKVQILFYHYILQQKEDSLIYQFLAAQKKCPVRGDWILNVQSNMEYIKSQKNKQQLKDMKKS